VVDQKEYPGAWMYYATFSPDSKHMAFISATNNSQYGISSRVVLDGVPGKTFDGAIQDLVFSPDSKTLAYKVNEGIATVYTVVHGGQEFDDYRESGDIVFSPDSRHMAFLADKQGQSFCIVDGREYLKGDDFMKGNLYSRDVTFSPDSKRWAYTAEHDGGVYAVISGNEYGPYESIGAEDGQAYIYFSPDSQHFAFMAARDKNGKGIFGRQFLVVDGHEYELQGGWWLFGSVLRFDSPTKLHGLVLGTDHFSRLQAEVRQKSN